MYIEILIIGIISFVVLTVNGYIKPNKFIYDNQDIFMKLKEDDYQARLAWAMADAIEKYYLLP